MSELNKIKETKKTKLLQDMTSILEEVCGDVCDNLCKYRDSVDDDFICDYIRENGTCPLDVLAR